MIFNLFKGNFLVSEKFFNGEFYIFYYLFNFLHVFVYGQGICDVIILIMPIFIIIMCTNITLFFSLTNILKCQIPSNFRNFTFRKTRDE